MKGKLPPSHSDGHGQVYDSKRDRLLCFHGAEKDSAGEVTEYDFTSGAAKMLNPMGKQKAALPSRETAYLVDADLVLIQSHVGTDRWLAYDCAANAWLDVKFAGPDPIGKQIFNNSVGLFYDTNRKLVWAVGQHSELWVLRFDPKTADVQQLR